MTERNTLIINNILDLCSHRLETIMTLISLLKETFTFNNGIRQIRKICEEHRILLSDNLTGDTEGGTLFIIRLIRKPAC